MSPLCLSQNNGVFVFFKNKGFCEEFSNCFLRDQLLNCFQNYNFKIKDFDVKKISSKSQKVKKRQNHTFTKHGVIMENFKND